MRSFQFINCQLASNQKNHNERSFQSESAHGNLEGRTFMHYSFTLKRRANRPNRTHVDVSKAEACTSRICPSHSRDKHNCHRTRENEKDICGSRSRPRLASTLFIFMVIRDVLSINLEVRVTSGMLSADDLANFDGYLIRLEKGLGNG